MGIPDCRGNFWKNENILSENIFIYDKISNYKLKKTQIKEKLLNLHKI